MNHQILAEIFQRLPERLDRLHFDSLIIRSKQPENRRVDRAQAFLAVGYLALEDDACVQVVGKQLGRVQRPATTETPAE